jgi:hypothetical protein
MQKLEGDGMVFVHAGGTVMERELQAGEELHVDTGCVVAFDPSVNFEIQQVGGIKSALFGGEGLFFAHLRGPGKVWLQSLPFSRLAGRMLAAAPQRGGSRGEGSVLGGLGNLLDGDNNYENARNKNRVGSSIPGPYPVYLKINVLGNRRINLLYPVAPIVFG